MVTELALDTVVTDYTFIPFFHSGMSLSTNCYIIYWQVKALYQVPLSNVTVLSLSVHTQVDRAGVAVMQD